MRKSAILAAVSACLLTLVAGSVLACGESLFRVGKGVAFRQYTAPLPGSIVVVTQTEAGFALVEQLGAAGHKVYSVSDPSEIGETIQNNDVDIVLAFYSQRELVLAQTGAASVAYVPVAIDGTDEVIAAKENYKYSLTNDDSFKTYMKTIHRTLKSMS